MSQGKDAVDLETDSSELVFHVTNARYPIIVIDCGGVSLSFLVDTGSQVCILKSEK